jgi:hypothetical protein
MTAVGVRQVLRVPRVGNSTGKSECPSRFLNQLETVQTQVESGAD